MADLFLRDALAARGAVLAGAGPGEVALRFGRVEDEVRAACAGAVLADRSWRGRLAIRGADRTSFLHGQATSDVRALADGDGQETMFLTGKGKLRGHGVLAALPGHHLLLVEGEGTDLLRSHLEAFVILEDVRIEDLAPSTVELAVLGPAAGRALAEGLGMELPSGSSSHPAALRAVAGGEIAVVMDGSAGIDGVSLVIPRAQAGAVFARLAEKLPLAGFEALESLRVEAGLARFGRELDEDTFPPEAGLDRALSLAKGCFTGYEVMARIKTYGHVNRQLAGLVLDGEARPGDAVREGDRAVGVVTSSAWSFALDLPVALAMLRREAAVAGTRLAIAGAAGAIAATVSELPFVRRDT